ncbi:MAG: competence/damage-inducible protein A [Verrucomicrobia bacterium]|nr:competence/damage-inducible protein A [Verrucomicrobiota bacterium]
MTAEVLNIGTELLLGDVVNTHAGWIAKRVFPMGLRILRQTTVPDGPAIRDGILEACGRADVLFVTGGLGPTTDDITREVVAELLGMKLQESAEIRERIAARFAERGFKMEARVARQAMVPAGAVVMPNNNGTAPGLYFAPVESPSSASPHVFLLPGPPRELQPMFIECVEPVLREICGGLEVREERVYRVVGLGESAVERMVGLELTANPALEVGYCARPNEVDLRLIGRKADLDGVEPRVRAVLGEFLVPEFGGDLAGRVVGRLGRLGKTLAVAESCTGGLLGGAVTGVPGSSEVFLQGFTTYSNSAKTSALGVDADLFSKHGAVSAEVAQAMAEGALRVAGSDFALSVTGVAGPGGGTPEKPVGLVFIGLARKGGGAFAKQFRFPGKRAVVREMAVDAALDLLLRELLQ